MSLNEVELKARFDQDAANQAVKHAFDQTYYQAIIDTAKGSIDRARTSGELVQKAAAAIGTLYAAIAGIVFSVTDRPLPVRGVIPTFFLGVAIVCSMAYLSYLGRPGTTRPVLPHTSPPIRMRRQAESYLVMVTDLVMRRSYALRLAVVALALGLLFLPAPFINLNQPISSDLDAKYPWPVAPTSVTKEQASLEAIVLKARIDEVTAERKAARQRRRENDTTVWILAGACVALMFAIPALLGGRRRHPL